MPRYLAIDYYGKALEERQNILYRMLLAVPHHLECIDNYAHKGKKDDKTYNVPWKKESQDKLVCKTPQDELSQITSKLSNLECFNAIQSQDEFIPSSNPDSPPINFDVWSDLEVEVVNFLVESLQSNDAEEFVEDTGLSQDQKFLEEQTSQDYLSEFLDKLPGVTALCSRLKPKVIQDPFADNTGKPLSECIIVHGADKDFSLSKDEEKLKRNQSFKETFILQQVEAPEIDNKLDMTLEMPSSPENILQRRNTDSKLPSKTQVDLENCATDDLQATTKEEVADIADEKKLLEQPQFLQNDKTLNDFVTLNTQGVSETSESQSVSDKKLESPMVTSREAPVMTPQKQNLPYQDLTPMSISPATSTNTNVISPGSRAEITDKIWQNEKVFNDILVKIFPVPNIKRNTTNTPTTTIPQKVLQKEAIHGDLELQLPWDPLTNTTCLAAINNKLSKVELFPHKKKTIVMEKETFEKIPWDDIAVEPISESSSIDTDLSLKTGSDTSVPWTKSPVEKVDFTSSRKSEPIEENAISINENSNIVPNKTQQIAEKRPQNLNQTVLASSIPTESSLKKRPWTPQIADDTLPSLGDFLLLRSMTTTGNGTPSRSCAYTKPIFKAAKVRPSVATPIATTVNSQEEPATLKPPSKHIKQVDLSTEYQEVVEFLTTSIHPFLAQLKQKGVIKQDGDITNLTPDYTRFAIKQVQMMIQNEDNHHSQLTCKLAVCLHVLVGALELVVHCGMDVALAHLSHSQEKYSAILGSALDSIRRHLFNAHVKFQQNSVLHPKIVTILETLRQWMDKERRHKVLIVSYRHTDFLYRQLKDILVSFGGIQVSLYNSQDELSSYLINTSDVVLVNAHSLTKDFPWALFSHVIEYENKTPNVVVPTNGQVEYIALVMQYGVKENSNANVEGDTTVQSKVETASFQQPHTLSQYVLIGSKNITTNDKLLLLLEGRHNIIIYERDYSCLYTSKDSKMNLQPHLMVDERTCVILEDLGNLDLPDKYEKLRDLVVSLSLKSTKCYIILCCKNENPSLTSNISNHLSMMFANVAYFKHNKSDFQMDIIYCNTIEQVAISIKRIADQARETSKVWEKDDWVKRKWLTVEMTRHERFLLSFPCMNSFSAQVMLTAAPLPRLLTMTLQELVSTCPWIPNNILSMFYQTTHLAPTVSREIPTCDTTPISEPTVNQSSIEDKDHNTATSMSSFNTPKSYASDDSLWLAIQDDNNTDCLNNIEYGEDLTETNPSYFEIAPQNGIVGEQYNPVQKSKYFGAHIQSSDNNVIVAEQYNVGQESKYFDGHNRPSRNHEIMGKQYDTMQKSKYFDNLNQPAGNQVKTRNAGSLYGTADIQTNAHLGSSHYLEQSARQEIDHGVRFDGSDSSDRVPRQPMGEWYRESRNINNMGNVHNLYEHADRVLKNTTEDWYRQNIRYHNPTTQSLNDSLTDKIGRASNMMPREWYSNQEANTDYRNPHRSHGYSEVENQNNVPMCQNSNRPLQVGNDVSGYRLAEIDTSMDNHSLTSSKHPGREYTDYPNSTHRDVYQPSTTVYGQQSSLYSNRDQRDMLKYKMLAHNTMMKNSDRSNIVTNVGVAQPRRRTNQQCQNIATDGRQRIEDHQGTTKPLKFQKEHVVPGFEPSPNDYLNELSIFGQWNEGHIPVKKQRLTYEKVPGAKDGQTKLIFS